MGKRILVQRRGRGSQLFRSLSHRKRGKARYLPPTEKERGDKIKFTIIDFVHERGRGVPLMLVRYEDGGECFLPAPEGVHLGQKLEQGLNADLEVGNVLPVHKIPEGIWVCNVEMRSGDGGRLCRASGTHGLVRSQLKTGSTILLPSRRVKTVHRDSRAMIGIISAGGRPDRPFVKAGLKRAFMRAKGHKSFPVVRGVAMNIASHPFGGGAHQGPGQPTTVSRNAPPGRKVGLIAARRTGLRRGRIRR
ncbi:MAG: 50S ribosomal protein L2 [Candidatus Heimdallarchaeota archaeon]|nr:MAG: 50S ribosomal protein L2 [Candidatus Heimdallarchaeota archaeon]